MKKVEELYEEILQDEGLKGEFLEAAKDNQIEAFLQKNDCNATLSQLQEIAEKKQSELGSLSDMELDAAAGGASGLESYLSAITLGIWCVGEAIRSATRKWLGPRESNDRLLCRL